jgi:glycosyltransferase involved in cell wall biosynthesis
MPQSNNAALRIGYLMQNGAPDLSAVSGPQLHTAAVVRGLQKLGHQVRIVAIQKNRLGWSDDLCHWLSPQFGWTTAIWFRLIESAVRRIQFELKLPFVGIFDSLHFADACAQLLKGCDVLYERYGYMGYGGVLAARWLRIPIIIELNGNIVKEIDEMSIKMSPIQRKLGRWLSSQTLRAANHVVVVSEALKRELMTSARMPGDRISVVLNGVNVELFARLYDDKSIRRRYNLRPSPTVTFVGSFQPWHGVELLVSSFNRVRSRVPDAQLILIGDGPGRDLVATQIAQMGLAKGIKLLGQLSQEQVAEILSVSDVAVAPYPFQHADIVGTPLKLLEYMAAGKAIVASTAPIHEIIEDQITGLRVPPADPDALAEAISRLLSDQALRARLGASARRQAQEQHSWDRVAEELSTTIWTHVVQPRTIYSTIRRARRFDT